MGSTQLASVMRGLGFLLLAILPSIQAFCLINTCSSYWHSVKNDKKVTGACAVIFDEGCCKASKTKYIIPRGSEGKGKLCSTRSSLNPLSSCKGPNLEDDVESLIVMPGCKLEVWDKDDGLEDQEKEEKKGYNQGDYNDNVDRYDKNKLVFSAQKGGQPHWVQELNDDFDDMNEDIASFRCTCA